MCIRDSGIPAANVVISGTHTHSAVNALGGPVRGYFSDLELTDYQKFVTLKRERHLQLSDYTSIWKVIIYLRVGRDSCKKPQKQA